MSALNRRDKKEFLTLFTLDGQTFLLTTGGMSAVSAELKKKKKADEAMLVVMAACQSNKRKPLRNIFD